MGWRPRQHRSAVAHWGSDRGALLPSLGALAVVTVVLVANFWSLLTSPPDLTTMDPLQRLSSLHDPLHLPGTAVASSQDGANSDAVALADPRSAPIVRLQAPVAGAPLVPVAVLTRSTIVEPGETLGAALARLFVHGQTAREVTRAYESLRDPQKLQAGWRLWARFASAGVMDSGALVSLVVAPQTGGGLTIERDEDGGYTSHEGGLPGNLIRQALRCGVVGTLEQSLRRCGEGEGLAELVQTLLTERMLRPIELRTGDELRIVMDKVMDGDFLVRYQQVAALEVRRAWSPRMGAQDADAGGFVEGRAVALWFDNGRGDAGYFTAEGASVEALFLRQPLRVGHLTSTYGMRLHPILHRMKAHLGIDFGAPRGTPVFAAASGHLVSAGRAGAGGNLVRLRHAEGFSTEYMHLQKFAVGLKAGAPVVKGQLIGYVGSTGRSTGPHLHFGARRHGQYLDPTELADVQVQPVMPHDRKAFEAETSALRRLLDALGAPPAGQGEAS